VVLLLKELNRDFKSNASLFVSKSLTHSKHQFGRDLKGLTLLVVVFGVQKIHWLLYRIIKALVKRGTNTVTAKCVICVCSFQ